MSRTKTPADRKELLPEQAAWLIGEEGEAAFALAEELASLSMVEQVAQLRRSFSAEKVHLVLQQRELQQRAEAKFPTPDRMRFTPLSLQQATDYWTARYKAARFREHDRLADLCCGIGGDLLAMAEELASSPEGGKITGVDYHPTMTTLAAYNCRQYPNVTVHTGAVESFDVSDYSAWHLDPDRRPDGKRTTRARFARPGIETIEELRRQCPTGAVKLAPGGVFPEAWEAEGECEWIGHHRQCRQLVVWFGGPAPREGTRRTTVIETTDQGSVIAHSFQGSPTARVPTAVRPLRYVMEPEPAIKAAKLTDALGESCQLEMLDDAGGYLTGDHPCDHPLFQVFEVLDVLPMDRKKLKRMIAERKIGHLEIKKRSVDVVPEILRRQLKLKGDRRAVLVLCAIDGKGTAILARRVPRREGTA